jgi:cation:H+ antiporter
LSAVIHPLSFTQASNPDILMTIGASLLLFVVLFIGKKHVVQRWQGVLFVLLYLAYVVFLVITQ